MKKIIQRKHDDGGRVFYETAIMEEVFGGWMPFVICYGLTQAEADDKLLNKLIK